MKTIPSENTMKRFLGPRQPCGGSFFVGSGSLGAGSCCRCLLFRVVFCLCWRCWLLRGPCRSGPLFSRENISAVPVRAPLVGVAPGLEGSLPRDLACWGSSSVVRGGHGCWVCFHVKTIFTLVALWRTMLWRLYSTRRSIPYVWAWCVVGWLRRRCLLTCRP